MEATPVLKASRERSVRSESAIEDMPKVMRRNHPRNVTTATATMMMAEVKSPQSIQVGICPKYSQNYSAAEIMCPY